LNELCPEIHGIHKGIRDDYDDFYTNLKELEEGFLRTIFTEDKNRCPRYKRYYKERLRLVEWEQYTPWRMLILIQLGFNGFYKRGRDDKFQTAVGNREYVNKLVHWDEIAQFKAMLDAGLTTLLNKSYLDVSIDTPSSVVFFDPPYIDVDPRLYSHSWSFEDTLDCVQYFKELANQGHTVFLANKEHDLFYNMSDQFTIEIIDNVHYSAGRNNKKKQAREILIHNLLP
jgi:site-specific DNA-adenine methylase